MRTPAFLLVVASALPASSATAQLLAAPALDHGSEISISAISPGSVSTGPSNGGAAAAFRRSGRVNFAARLTHFGSRMGGTYAEVGTFGPLRRVAAAEIAFEWGLGVGYSSDAYGMYIPLDVSATGEVHIGSLRTAPYAQLRVALTHVDPFEREAGHLDVGAGVGLDLRMHGPWAARAGVASHAGTSALLLGVAYRP